METSFEYRKTKNIYNLLRVVFGIVPIVAGLDKFTNILTYWPNYLSPIATGIIPFSAQTFMYIVGVIEIIAGIIVLARPQVGAYIVSAWLLCIAINLITTGAYFDVAVRDIVMSISAFSLGQLSSIIEARKRATEPVLETQHFKSPRAA